MRPRSLVFWGVLLTAAPAAATQWHSSTPYYIGNFETASCGPAVQAGSGVRLYVDIAGPVSAGTLDLSGVMASVVSCSLAVRVNNTRLHTLYLGSSCETFLFSQDVGSLLRTGPNTIDLSAAFACLDADSLVGNHSYRVEHVFVTHNGQAPAEAYEILVAQTDRRVYQNGVDTATVTVTAQRRTGPTTPATLTVSAVRLDGSEVLIGTHASIFSPQGPITAQLAWPVPDATVPVWYTLRVKILEGNAVVLTRDFEAFSGTPLSPAQIAAQVAQLEECALELGPFESLGVQLISAPVPLGALGGAALSIGTAAVTIIDGTCKRDRYLAAGQACEAQVMEHLVRNTWGVLAVGMLVLVVAPPAALAAGVLWTAFGFGLVDQYLAGRALQRCDAPQLRLAAFGDAPLGAGDIARGYVDHVGAISDSLGVSFALHALAEGPVRARLTLPCGWVSTDSTALDDAIGDAIVPEALLWLMVGPRASRLANGPDSSLAPADSLWPAQLTVRGTGTGPTFLGIALRAPGSMATLVRYYPGVIVQPSTVMTVMLDEVGPISPLAIDYDGDGTVDETREARLPTDVTIMPTRAAQFALRVWPTPAHQRATFEIVAPDAMARAALAIFDVAGRCVYRRELGPVAVGRREVVWDAQTASGTRVASGLYYGVLETAHGRSAARRFVLLR